MNLDENKPESLSGSLLVASPSLRDPNFFHTVLLLASHNTEDGAFGYILNRPLDKRVGDLLDDKDLGRLGEVPVYLGGPVGTNKLSFAALNWNTKKRELRIQTHLSTEQAMKEIQKGRVVRGFVGYSGWSEGQLENELEQNSWITCAPLSKIVSHQPPSDLWTTVLDDLGPYYKLLARMPADPSLN
ncbi:MAG: YqgE/AlgH family protein [Verrucomicrobium sp.]|nr:YqgE/AlgH family protein [Verrucomicrobium sp.]